MASPDADLAAALDGLTSQAVDLTLAAKYLPADTAEALRPWAEWTSGVPPLERAKLIGEKLEVLDGLVPNPREMVDAALSEADVARACEREKRTKAELARLPHELTESAVAHLFAAQHVGELWSVPGRGWLVYAGKEGRFKEDEDAALRAVQNTVAGMRSAVTASRPDDKKALTFVSAAASARGLKAILSLAQIEPALRAEASEFDSGERLVNLQNGVFDLESGVLGPHDRTQRHTRIAGVSADPDAACPLWEQHLARILASDAALTTFLQRWAGRALSGIRSSDNCRILMPYGTGANGKTVTVETISAVLGEYAAAKDFTSWCTSRETSGSSQRQDLVDLAGLRLVTSTESGYHHRLDEALLKQYTGGERVAPRGMYAKQATVYRPQFSLLLSTNHLPSLDGADQGFWRRFLKMGFEVMIPEPDQDADLLGRLAGELPGIFNWMCEGYAMWRERGLDPPTSVLMETAQYRSDIDLIGQFVEQHLCRQEGEDTELSAVFERYTTWCVKCGINHRLTIQQLSSRLVEHGLGRGHGQPHRRAVIKDMVLLQPTFDYLQQDSSSSKEDDHPSEFPF